MAISNVIGFSGVMGAVEWFKKEDPKNAIKTAIKEGSYSYLTYLCWGDVGFYTYASIKILKGLWEVRQAGENTMKAHIVDLNANHKQASEVAEQRIRELENENNSLKDRDMVIIEPEACPNLP